MRHDRNVRTLLEMCPPSKFVTIARARVFSRKPDCGVAEDNARIKPTYVLSITLPLGCRCTSLFAMSSHSQATQSYRYRVTHRHCDLRAISHLDKFLQNKHHRSQRLQNIHALTWTFLRFIHEFSNKFHKLNITFVIRKRRCLYCFIYYILLYILLYIYYYILLYFIYY